MVFVTIISICLFSCKGKESLQTDSTPSNIKVTEQATPEPTIIEGKKSKLPELRPFNPKYPVEDTQSYENTEKISETESGYSPYSIETGAGTMVGGFKNYKWYLEWNFMVNGIDYDKLLDGLTMKEEWEEINKLDGAEITGKCALINDETILKLYSKTGYIGEYKPAPFSIKFSLSLAKWMQFDLQASDTKGSSDNVFVGISHENPFPRKPIHLEDGLSFEIDLNNDRQKQKVIFHKVITEYENDDENNWYTFEYVVELIAYGKSYIINEYESTLELIEHGNNYIIGGYEGEENIFYEDEYFKEYLNSNWFSVLPIDLNGDGKMELVCYSGNKSGVPPCGVFMLDENDLYYINYSSMHA